MDMTVTRDTEVVLGGEVKAADVPAVDLSFKNEDFAKDMEKLRAATIPTPAPVEEKAVPATDVNKSAQDITAPKQEPEKSEVPSKFKTPDGKIDEAKVEKSLINAEEAVAKYLAKQKELNRLINETKAKENAYLRSATTTPATPATPTPVEQPSSFEQMIEADLQKEGAGKTLSKLFNAAREAALEQFRGEITPIQASLHETQVRNQVEAIGKSDPWVYTPEGIDTLTKILNDKPFLQNSDNPYRDAYLFWQGARLVSNKVDSQVSTPTPTARASAPIPTAQAANSTDTPVVRLDSPDSIAAHLGKLSAKEQSDFFKKMGFPAF